MCIFPIISAICSLFSRFQHLKTIDFRSEDKVQISTAEIRLIFKACTQLNWLFSEGAFFFRSHQSHHLCKIFHNNIKARGTLNKPFPLFFVYVTLCFLFQLKFSFFEKAKIICAIFRMVWTFTVKVQTMRKIVQFLWPSQKSWTLLRVKKEPQKKWTPIKINLFIILWKSRCNWIRNNAPLLRKYFNLLYLLKSEGLQEPSQRNHCNSATFRKQKRTFLRRKVRSSQKPCNFSFSISRRVAWRSNGAFEGNSLTFLQSFYLSHFSILCNFM